VAATPSILIVDDTPANLGAVVDALEQQGYRVFIAQDGEEALERAGLVTPDLILLDVLMPGIDGLETCRRLKADAKLHAVPVLFMTALAQMSDKVAGFDAGALDYITKPLQIDEVLARVAVHIKLHSLQKQLEVQNAELRHFRESLEQQVAARTEEVRLMSYALNRVREAAYLLDEDARMIYVNDEACRALGYAAEELKGMTVLDIDPHITKEFFAKLWSRAKRVGAGTAIETIHRRKDGTQFPIEVNGSYFCYGGKDYLLALARDISERKVVEQKIQASAQAFRAAVENSPDYVIRYDLVYRRTYINPAALAMQRKPVEDLLGRTPLDGSSIVDGVRFMEQMRLVVRTGHEIAYEAGISNPAGQTRWCHLRIVPEFGSDGSVASILSIGRDIHEIKESQLRFRALAESFPDLMVRFDNTCRLTYVNPIVSRTFGIAPETCIGMHVSQLRPDPEQGSTEALEAGVRAALASGEPNDTVVKWRSQGVLHTYELRHIPERDATGAVISVLTIGRDITKLAEAEQTLRDSFGTLRKLATRRETAREEERKRIAREIHDELGQYLTALKMHVAGLRIALGSEQSPLVERTDTLVDLTNKTLAVARNLATTLRPPALDGGIGPALEWLATEFTNHARIACELRLPKQKVDLAEERALALFRVVQESLTNVARHAKADRVAISLIRLDDECRVEIRDDGSGFDASAQPQGSLGLLGMSERMMMVGGQLTIASSPGQGTQIAATIPVCAGEGAQ